MGGGSGRNPHVVREWQLGRFQLTQVVMVLASELRLGITRQSATDRADPSTHPVRGVWTRWR